jgi:hypothetical protein
VSVFVALRQELPRLLLILVHVFGIQGHDERGDIHVLRSRRRDLQAPEEGAPHAQSLALDSHRHPRSSRRRAESPKRIVLCESA